MHLHGQRQKPGSDAAQKLFVTEVLRVVSQRHWFGLVQQRIGSENA